MSFWERSEEKKSTVELIKQYVKETGNRAFTYADLRAWYYGTGTFQTYRRDWHTIERLLRKLAEDGYLLRYKWKRTVKFVLPPQTIPAVNLKHRYASYKKALYEGRMGEANMIVKEVADLLQVDENTAIRVMHGVVADD